MIMYVALSLIMLQTSMGSSSSSACPSCTKCGINWYDQHWNRGRPTLYFKGALRNARTGDNPMGYCKCCKADAEEWVACADACSGWEANRCKYNGKTVRHGDSLQRVMYETRWVNAPDSCEEQTQTGYCHDGTIIWTPNDLAKDCDVLAQCTYDGKTVSHGTSSLKRDMFEKRSVFAPASCKKQTQTGSCNDGTITWSPNKYIHKDCTVYMAPVCPNGYYAVPQNLDGVGKLWHTPHPDPTRTIDDCADLCNKRKGCTSFEFAEDGSESGACGTYTGGVSNRKGNENRLGEKSKWRSCMRIVNEEVCPDGYYGIEQNLDGAGKLWHTPHPDPTRTIDDCADLCNKRNGCTSFEFARDGYASGACGTYTGGHTNIRGNESRLGEKSKWRSCMRM